MNLLPPVPNPGRIFGVGLNYRDHIAEAGRNEPEHPTVFVKLSSSACGHGDRIIYPANSTRVDYEGELGVVIGEPCRHLREDEALSVVAGYVNVNDVSARDWQSRSSQWTLGKSFETFTPLGPALVTPNEVGDPQGLDLTVTVNGEVRQHANTAQMIFPVARLIAEISAVCTLQPGDIISTGTPAGVGIGFDPERCLAVGDIVNVHVAGLGTLSNVVAAEVGT
jgi:2-keto-4-pentenoate hydratase/2-oxohepta-3-ene-1,7-dioic acid hydratase in catechol pathway